MSFACPYCKGTILVSAGANANALSPTSTQQGGDKVEVDFAGFRDLCFMISQKPEAKDFAAAMDSLPRGLQQYGSLT